MIKQHKRDKKSIIILCFTENNLMGAAEWTGYSSPAAGSAYTPFQHSYDQSSALPTVLPNDGLSYNPSDYHCGASAQSAAAYNSAQFTPLTPWSNEMEQYNYGYNGYQYPCQPTQSQYPPTAAPSAQTTMVLYPQLYSTVNQNQIHLHLHGSDKLVEQYLGGSGASIQSDNAFAVNPVASMGSLRSSELEISENALIAQEDENSIKQHQEQSVVDPESGDQSVWRPY